MASRSQASGTSRRAAQLAALDSIGGNRAAFQTGAINVVEGILFDFIEKVKDNIQATPDFVDTGAIEDIRVEMTSENIDLIIPNHLIFQDLGVNGSVDKPYNTEFTYRELRPPVQVFKNWIRSKNIQLRNEESLGGNPSRFEDLTEEEQINSAAWCMSIKIWKEGFRPRNVYSKEIPQLISDIESNVADFASDFFRQLMVNNNGSVSRVPPNTP